MEVRVVRQAVRPVGVLPRAESPGAEDPGEQRVGLGENLAGPAEFGQAARLPVQGVVGQRVQRGERPEGRVDDAAVEPQRPTGVDRASVDEHPPGRQRLHGGEQLVDPGVEQRTGAVPEIAEEYFKDPQAGLDPNLRHITA